MAGGVAPAPEAQSRARLGSARLGSARLGSARLGSARLGSARLRIAASKRALDVKSFVESFIPNFSPSAPFRLGHRARFNTTRAAQRPDDGDEQRVRERMRSDPAGTGISPGVPSAAVPATGALDSAPRTPAEAPIWFRNSRDAEL